MKIGDGKFENCAVGILERTVSNPALRPRTISRSAPLRSAMLEARALASLGSVAFIDRC